MFFTVIGTLSHELGHIAVAKYFGKETKLHYGSMNSYSKERANDPKYIEMRKIANDNWKKIINKEDFNEKEKYFTLKKYVNTKYPHNKFQSKLITIGGPFQTMLTSFIGLFILGYRNSKNKQEYQILDWLGIFLSLFALREVFNFITGLYATIFYQRSNFHGDEYVISRSLGYNEWIIPTLMMLIGTIISFYVIFRILPLKFRFTFIISGLIGSVIGFTIWFGGLGALLIP